MLAPALQGAVGMWLRADVYETDRALHLEIEVPGIARPRLRLHVDSRSVRLLAVPSARDPGPRRYLRRERPGGARAREIPLPRAVRPSSARAWLTNGVLHLRLPLDLRPRAREDAPVPILGVAPALEAARLPTPSGQGD